MSGGDYNADDYNDGGGDDYNADDSDGADDAAHDADAEMIGETAEAYIKPLQSGGSYINVGVSLEYGGRFAYASSLQAVQTRCFFLTI